VSNLKDCVCVVIKHFEIKNNLIKNMFELILFSKNKCIKVKDINVNRIGMRERIGD
jgi:hypothetical protein